MVSNWTVQCKSHGIKLDGTVYSTWYQTGRYSVKHMVSGRMVQCTAYGIKTGRYSVQHMVLNWTLQCTAHGVREDGRVYSTWYQGGRYSVQHMVSNWTVQCTTHGIKLDCSVYTAHGIKLDGTVYGYSVEHMVSN